MRVVLGDLGLHEGGALPVKRALRMGEPGGEVAVSARRRNWSCVSARGAGPKDANFDGSGRATYRR